MLSSVPYWQAGSRDLRGHNLRQAAIAMLVLAGRPLTVAEVLTGIEVRGCRVLGSDPRKALADALAYEHGRGRVARVSRGTYRAGRLARTTEWRVMTRYGRGAA
jgi:hypothetical protein